MTRQKILSFTDLKIANEELERANNGGWMLIPGSMMITPIVVKEEGGSISKYLYTLVLYKPEEQKSATSTSGTSGS